MYILISLSTCQFGNPRRQLFIDASISDYFLLSRTSWAETMAVSVHLRSAIRLLWQAAEEEEEEEQVPCRDDL